MLSTDTALITLTPSMAALTDEIGFIRSEIKRLEALDKELTDKLKSAGAGKHVGAIYKSTVSPTDARVTVNWQAVAMHFEPSHQLITAHTTKGEPGFRAVVSKK